MFPIYTIDFETTNRDPKEAVPVEVALVDCYRNVAYASLIDPKTPIPPETSAIHHITNKDVEGMPDWEYMQHILMTNLEQGYEQRSKSMALDSVVLVAHNAKYEQGIMEGMEFTVPVSWICTYKCALVAWPDAPAFSNEALRYWRELGTLGRSQQQMTHSALHDAQVTKLLFLDLSNSLSVEEMIKISSEPARLPYPRFGKHRGNSWEEIPSDYLLWMTRQKEMDEDHVFCARKELERRKLL